MLAPPGLHRNEAEAEKTAFIELAENFRQKSGLLVELTASDKHTFSDIQDLAIQ